MVDQKVILVNEQDEPIGAMDKLEAHRLGLLHRAFSVFIFNEEGQMLLQKRAATKYHGAGLWSNACCSHPYVNEPTEKAALRRLQEELGFETGLKKIFHFTYKVSVENGLTENEFDHVFVGRYSDEIKPNSEEVSDFAYLSLEEIKEKIQRDETKFTTWFRIAFPRIESWWQKEYCIAT